MLAPAPAENTASVELATMAEEATIVKLKALVNCAGRRESALSTSNSRSVVLSRTAPVTTAATLRCDRRDSTQSSAGGQAFWRPCVGRDRVDVTTLDLPDSTLSGWWLRLASTMRKYEGSGVNINVTELGTLTSELDPRDARKRINNNNKYKQWRLS